MNRTGVLTAVMIAALVVAFFSGASTSPGGAKPVDEKKPDDVKPAAARPQIAVFNMAAVIRDFDQAKYQVWLLNNKRAEKSKHLLAMRAEYIQLTGLKVQPNRPDTDEIAEKILALHRKIEDEDRKITKQLNDEANAINGDLYDKIKTAVDKTAEMNGYKAVFAYPDAATEEEQKSPYIKELKLKPPAAQPFYVSADIDITRVVIKTLNVWYPPTDKETGKPVNVSNLPVPQAPSSDFRPTFRP